MNEYYYTGQPVILRLTPDIDVSAAAVLRIYYRKPNGDTGYWTAAYSSGAVVYTANVSEAGTWQFKVYSDGVYSLPVYESFVNP